MENYDELGLGGLVENSPTLSRKQVIDMFKFILDRLPGIISDIEMSQHLLNGGIVKLLLLGTVIFPSKMRTQGGSYLNISAPERHDLEQLHRPAIGQPLGCHTLTQ